MNGERECRFEIEHYVFAYDRSLSDEVTIRPECDYGVTLPMILIVAWLKDTIERHPEARWVLEELTPRDSTKSQPL